MKPKALVEAYSVMLSPRIAAMFETHFGLHRLRSAVRGADAELDDALLSIHVAAMTYVEQTEAALDDFRSSRKRVAEVPEAPPSLLSVSDVADFVDCTDRAVRFAAEGGRLHGAKDHRGRWRFERDDVAAWAATRTMKGRAA